MRRLPEAPGDAGLVQVVRGHFHFDAVAGGNANPAFAHLAANGREDHVFVWQFDAEHGAREHDRDDAFYFNMLFFDLSHWFFRKACSRTTCAPQTIEGAEKKRARPV